MFAGRLHSLALEYKEMEGEKVSFRGYLGDKGISVKNLSDLTFTEERTFDA